MDLSKLVRVEGTLVPSTRIRPMLSLLSNQYIVYSGGVYNYFPILLEDVSGDDLHPLIRMKKSPPVIMPGFVVHRKKVYAVTVPDLLRKIVRKSRELTKDEINLRTGRSSPIKKSSNLSSLSEVSESLPELESQPRLEVSTKLEDDSAIDTAWAEQIGSLLCIISEKEGGEWEVTENP